MLRYFINSIFLILLINNSFSQEKNDSISYKTNYGLRLGIDISKPTLSLIDKSYNGFEIVSDYRISKRWYIATEIGYEDEKVFDDYFSTSTSGSYLRIGTNYNTYNNWLNMNNEIYIGGRYGFSMFNQTLNSYTPNVNTLYFPAKTKEINSLTSGLNGHWLEFQLGIKVETFKNLFVSFHGAFKASINISDPSNFESFYSPGFNTINSNNTGFGFNYTLSYLIPFQKK